MEKRPQALKSFYIMAHNERNCYRCPYCVLSCREDLIESNLEHSFEYDNNMPPPINTLPVSINNYFGDPFIQKEDTFKKMKILERAGHKGIVAIITKSYITEEIAQRLSDTQLKLQVLYSVSGTKDNFDGVSYKKKVESLERLINAGINASLYYRPIIAGINDSEEMIKQVLEDYKAVGGKAFSYAGLMGKKSVLNLLKMNGYFPKIPNGHEKWLEDKKLMPKDKKQFLLAKAKELGLNAFMKTSCLASFTAGLSHDYNNHFYKPEQYNCGECTMYSKCKSFKESVTEESAKAILDSHGIKYESVEKTEKGICPSIAKCSRPSAECHNMKSTFVNMGKITRGDESIIKWVSGAMAKADIAESSEVTILDHLL
ncbi:MAG: radical SAM protein [Candidatus Nanoarchaeia archaeon]|jgi:DNA repair photolyase